MKNNHILLLVLCLLSAGACSGSDDKQGDATLPDVKQEVTALLEVEQEASDEPDIAGDTGPGDLKPETESFQCRQPVPERIVDDNPDDTFDLGPYLMAPTPTAITIMWRTLDKEDGAVLYGLADEPDTEIKETGTKFIHSVRIEGLQPDTRYAYRVRSGTRTCDVHHFYTAPEEGGSFRFTAWGDSQGGEPFHKTVTAMLNDAPHVLLGLGDLVHDGRIDSHWKDHLFDPARRLLHEVPLFTAFGNHGKNGPLFYKLMGYENLAVSPQSESVYTWTWGNAFFLVVDTNGLFFDIGDIETEWSAWIKEQVASPAAQNATWRIAYAHEPGASTETSAQLECGGTVYAPITGWLLPLLQQHDFHAYLCGHVHLYERTMVGNLVHIIAGGGGGGLDYCEVTPTPISHIQVRHHFIRGLVGCDTLRLEAVAHDGEVFDFIELAPGTPGTIIDQGPVPFFYQDPDEVQPD